MVSFKDSELELTDRFFRLGYFSRVSMERPVSQLQADNLEDRQVFLQIRTRALNSIISDLNPAANFIRTELPEMLPS